MNPTIPQTFKISLTFDWYYPSKPMKKIEKSFFLSNDSKDNIEQYISKNIIPRYTIGICKVENVKIESERIYTFEEWVEKYNPIKNEIEESTTYEGFAFETYGEELDFVREHNPENIWTIITNGADMSYLVSGMRWVDREFYFVTNNPVTEEDKNTEFYI
jgi:hypothetical protein